MNFCLYFTRQRCYLLLLHPLFILSERQNIPAARLIFLRLPVQTEPRFIGAICPLSSSKA